MRAKSFLSAPGRISASRFQAEGVKNTIGRPKRARAALDDTACAAEGEGGCPCIGGAGSTNSQKAARA